MSLTRESDREWIDRILVRNRNDPDRGTLVPCAWDGLQRDLLEMLAEARAEERERAESLREALAPFALFASAVKGVPLDKDIVNYGHQGLRANAFKEAAEVFAAKEPTL